jgi:RNAse (barnase) inhibitor barstar
MKTFVIDGKKCSNLECFYVHIDSVFTKSIHFKTGHNLDAFNDILSGGFGTFESEENIKIVWKNFSKSEKTLGKSFISDAIEIINNHYYITLEIE